MGCTGAEASIEPTPSSTLFPFQSSLATDTPTRSEATVEPELTPAPSPTPLTHIVQEGETLLDIAYRYGAELNELLVANPGINPRFLSIGQPLLIPGPEGDLIGALAPTTTPHPVMLTPANCYRIPSGALWCLTSASHSRSGKIEGLALVISLLGDDFEPLRSEIAFSPLNLVISDQPMPMGALFDPPVPEYSFVDLAVISSVYIEDVGDRYLPVNVTLDASEKAPDGLSWSASGTIHLSDAGESDLRLVLVAAAFSSNGDLVGFSTWEAVTQSDVELPVQFDLTIFSLGSEIDRILVQAEALVLPD
jgi:LysM repeat protein